MSENRRKPKGLDVDINGNFTGTISISTETPNVVGDVTMPLGTHVEGTVTPITKATESTNPEMGVNSETESIVQRVGAEIESSAKQVRLIQNTKCAITLHEPQEVEIIQCIKCDVTIYTADPEKITVKDVGNIKTEITYLDPEDDSEWDWPPEDSDNEDGDDDSSSAPTVFRNDSGQPKVIIGGKHTGNVPVVGNNQEWKDGQRIK